MKNIEKYIKCMAIIAMAALVITLIPMIVIGSYTHPLGDDYYYGVPAITALNNGEGLGGAISAAIEGTAEQYRIWQGTYSAMFLMHLPPQIWGEVCYKLYPAFMILLVTISLFYFLRPFFKTEDKAEKYAWLTISALAAFLHINFVPLCGETFYWYNGSIYYTGFYALTLLFWGGVVRLINKFSWVRVVVLCIGALIIAGGNYASLLPTLIILVFVTAFSYMRKLKKQGIGMTIVLVAMLAGFAVSVLAPGNALRQATSFSISPVKAVLKSLVQCFGYLVHWSNAYLFIALLIATPALIYVAERRYSKYRLPIIACPIMFGIFASSECPTFYAQNNGGAARVFDICFYMMILCIGFMYYYLVAGILKYIKRKKGTVDSRKVTAGACISLAIIFAVLLFVRPIEESFTEFNSIKATASLVNGEAAYYDKQYRERLAVIESGKPGDIVLDEIDVPENLKYFLWLGDISGDTEANSYYAEYYGVNSIRIR